MIPLDTPEQIRFAFILVAILGAVGGIVYELMLSFRKRSGSLPLPSLSRNPRRLHLGFVASMIIGAVAAVAFLWIFPPTITITPDDAGGNVTKSTYDIFKLVGLSLIAGSAGRSLIGALQARSLALIKQNEADATSALAKEQLASVDITAQKLKSNEATPAELSSAVKMAIASLDANDSSRRGNPDESGF